MGGTATGAAARAPSPAWLQAVRKFLPPARLVWLSLVALGVYSLDYLNGTGVSSLLLAPGVAVLVDLTFQRVRFDRVRVPDAALATGLFVALVLPPSAPLGYLGIASFAAVALRHILRSSGHPWFNPASVGILVGAFAFGLAPAWWAGVGPLGEYLVVALGIGLIVRSPAQWRLPAAFLGAYGVLATVQHVILGATTDPHILLLQATDPTTVFFALFMIAEPRTAPSSPAGQPLYAGLVGTIAAFAPLFSPSAGLLLALLAGNLLAVGLRRAETARARTPASSAKARRRPTPLTRWSATRRAGAGLVVGIVLLGALAAAPAEHAAPILVAGVPGGGGGTLGGGCTNDNASIASSTLQSLHKMLGPAVILSYTASNGVVVFYDPVNHVTVTETDLYEDYGFAEFNGDDYAVSGCAA